MRQVLPKLSLDGPHVDVVVPLELAECGEVRDLALDIQRLDDRAVCLARGRLQRRIGVRSRSQVAA